MTAVTICSDFWAPQNKVSHCFIVSPFICHEVMGLDAMILVFWMMSFKPTFPLSSFIFIKGKPFIRETFHLGNCEKIYVIEINRLIWYTLNCQKRTMGGIAFIWWNERDTAMSLHFCSAWDFMMRWIYVLLREYKKWWKLFIEAELLDRLKVNIHLLFVSLKIFFIINMCVLE